MTLGEILDRTFEVYRKRFLLFVGIGALPALVMLGLRSVDIAWFHTERWLGTLERGEDILWSWVVAYGYYHISGFLNLLFFPALVQPASSEVLGGSTTIVASLRFALARWRSYLWLAFLVHVAVLILPEALAFGVFFGIGTLEDKLGLLNDSPSVPAIVLLLLPIPAGFVLFLWAKAAFSLSIPAAALEPLSAFKALRRSWILTRESRWRIVVAWLAVAICSWALLLAVWYALSWAVYLLWNVWRFHWLNQHVTSQVAYTLYAAIAALVGPIFPIAVTLLYYDQRVRKEDYDLEQMMTAAGWTAVPTLSAAENPPGPLIEVPSAIAGQINVDSPASSA
jgi:hypothetical protein